MFEILTHENSIVPIVGNIREIHYPYTILQFYSMDMIWK